MNVSFKASPAPVAADLAAGGTDGLHNVPTAQASPASANSDGMAAISFPQAGPDLQASPGKHPTHAGQAEVVEAAQPSSVRAGVKARLKQLLFGVIYAQPRVMH